MDKNIERYEPDNKQEYYTEFARKYGVPAAEAEAKKRGDKVNIVGAYAKTGRSKPKTGTPKTHAPEKTFEQNFNKSKQDTVTAAKKSIEAGNRNDYPAIIESGVLKNKELVDDLYNNPNRYLYEEIIRLGEEFNLDNPRFIIRKVKENPGSALFFSIIRNGGIEMSIRNNGIPRGLYTKENLRIFLSSYTDYIIEQVNSNKMSKDEGRVRISLAERLLEKAHLDYINYINSPEYKEKQRKEFEELNKSVLEKQKAIALEKEEAVKNARKMEFFTYSPKDLINNPKIIINYFKDFPDQIFETDRNGRLKITDDIPPEAFSFEVCDALLNIHAENIADKCKSKQEFDAYYNAAGNLLRQKFENHVQMVNIQITELKPRLHPVDYSRQEAPIRTTPIRLKITDISPITTPPPKTLFGTLSAGLKKVKEFLGKTFPHKDPENPTSFMQGLGEGLAEVEEKLGTWYNNREAKRENNRAGKTV